MDNTILVAIASSFMTTLVAKGAEAPAQTLNLLWKSTFGRWDKSMEAYIARRNGDVKEYAEEIAIETDKIPEDKIKSEIDISIVGPTLEASKYYIGNAEIRRMFAKLIAASMDSRLDGKVHHAYVEIIKEMNPIDAKVLADLNNPSYVIYYALNRHGVGSVFEDLYMSDLFTEPSLETAISISNLERLGLIRLDRYRNGLSVGTDGLLGPMVERFKNTEFYKCIPEAVDPYFTIDQVAITTLGGMFRSVCIQD